MWDIAGDSFVTLEGVRLLVAIRKESPSINSGSSLVNP